MIIIIKCNPNRDTDINNLRTYFFAFLYCSFLSRLSSVHTFVDLVQD